MFYFCKLNDIVNSPTDTFTINILVNELITDRSHLIHTIINSLDIPYFDGNWDAFEEDLNEMFWFEKIRQVRIIHAKVPRLDHSDMIIYLSILKRTEITWETCFGRVFQVWFPEDSRDFISIFSNTIEGL